MPRLSRFYSIIKLKKKVVSDKKMSVTLTLLNVSIQILLTNNSAIPKHIWISIELEKGQAWEQSYQGVFNQRLVDADFVNRNNSAILVVSI